MQLTINKKRLTYILFWTLYFGAFNYAFASSILPDTTKAYSRNVVVNDLEYCKLALTHLHPSFYRYRSNKDIDSIFRAAEQAVPARLNELEAWKLLQETIVSIESGHTAILFPNDEKYMRTTHPILPFNVYVRGNSLYVKAHLAPDTTFNIGDEILSIDGVGCVTILRNLRKLIPGEGKTNAFKDFQLERGAFNKLINIVLGEREYYKISFQRPAGITESKVRTITGAIRIDERPRPPVPDQPQKTDGTDRSIKSTNTCRLDYLPDLKATALLKIPGFSYKDYKEFHRSVFNRLKEDSIKNLVIDLRGNSGGLDLICIDLLRYLLNKDFNYTRKIIQVKIAKQFKILNGIIDSDSLHLSSLANVIKDSSTVGAISVSNNHAFFKGNLFIFADGGTFSASTLLLSALKSQRQCFVIGQETGGLRSGSYGGSEMSLSLPGTKLTLQIPTTWVQSTSTSVDDGMGISPNRILMLTPLQIYNQLHRGTDPYIGNLKAILEDFQANN